MARAYSLVVRVSRAPPRCRVSHGSMADQVTLVFPAKTIPLRMTGVAVRQDGTWRLVQLHVSAAVSDEALLSA